VKKELTGLNLIQNAS
jgi:hypothetical protein